MDKVGLIINPVSGLGGSVGLKGTDGHEIVQEALARGAVPRSSLRTSQALEPLLAIKNCFSLITPSGAMGEETARAVGFSPLVILGNDEKSEDNTGLTSSQDTVSAALTMKHMGADLILFAGGDGTARDVMDAIGETVTVVGIPAGVKMHSGVFAADPRNAGLLAKEYLEGKARTTVSCEVMDIDEEAFRENRLSAQLYGYMKIPQSRGRTQGGKVSSPKSLHEVEGIGMAIADKMEADVLYIIGPGSTTVSIMEAIGIPYTLLGIDLVINKQLIAADVTEKRILESLGFQTKAKIVVTPIGGQAYLFGRGNQQISPEVIRQVGKENIVIVATRAKLATFSGSFLRVDTGDPELDRELSGYYRVQVDYREETVFRVGG